VEFAQLFVQLREVALPIKQAGQFDVCFQPQPLIVGALEGLEGERVEHANADASLFVFGIFLDEIKHVVDGLFRVVAGNSGLDVCEELAIVIDGLFNISNCLGKRSMSG
jgi:hypothetical protein